MLDTSDMDPELARYLNRNYWEQKREGGDQKTTAPSAPSAANEGKAQNVSKVAEVSEVPVHFPVLLTNFDSQ